MRTFQDNQKRTWEVDINVDSVKQVRSLLDVDLLEALDGHLLQQLVTRPILLCNIVFCLCKAQADTAEISDEDFGRAMAGDAIDDATTAFLEELVDFFPRARREVLKKALAKTTELEAMAMDAAKEVLESDRLESLLKAELESGLELPTSPSASPRSGDSSTDSQAPSESTPED